MGLTSILFFKPYFAESQAKYPDIVAVVFLPQDVGVRLAGQIDATGCV
jgi:hypothetical protein